MVAGADAVGGVDAREVALGGDPRYCVRVDLATASSGCHSRSIRGLRGAGKEREREREKGKQRSCEQPT